MGTAFGLLKLVIASEFSRHRELDDSTKIAEEDSSFYKKIVNGTAARKIYAELAAFVADAASIL